MVSIQNATLAGGVAVGSSADLVIQPSGAILIGMLAGTLSVVGYVYIQPALEKHVGLDDTCGVHNLHGMPGLLGGIGGALSASIADTTLYGETIGTVFPARMDTIVNGTITVAGRSAGAQGGAQLAALGITVAVAIVGGVITGFIIKAPFLLGPGKNAACMTCGASSDPSLWYDDEQYWEVPADEEEGGGGAAGAAEEGKRPGDEKPGTSLLDAKAF